MLDTDGARATAASKSLNEPPGKLRRDLMILTLVTLGALGPFLNKPVHLDDPLFVWCAEQICETPENPFIRFVNWGGSVLPMYAETRNPPGACYLLAVTGTVFGWHEVAFHGVFLLVSIATCWGSYFLARAMTRSALWAALAGLATPVFLVSASTLMCDVLMLCFWVWAIYCWRRGHEERVWGWLAAAAVLAGAAAFSKHFALSLIPLLAVDGWYRRRRVGAWLVWLAVPLVAALLVDVWMIKLYRSSSLAGASEYAASMPGRAGLNIFKELLVGLSFAGGCMLSAIFFVPAMCTRRTFAIGLGVAGLGVAFFFMLGQWVHDLPWENELGVLWTQLILFSIFATAGVWLLGLSVWDYVRTRDADGLLLLLWIGGTFIFAGVVNWTTNGRSILPMVPALGILIARAMDRREARRPDGAGAQGTGRVACGVAVTLALGLSMLLAWADYAWAWGFKRAALELHARYATVEKPIYFDDHWGFQYYMEGLGAQHLDRLRSTLEPGDVLIRHDLNPSPIHIEETLRNDAEVIGEHAYGGLPWIGTVSSKLGAGFYADFWGPLPWTIGPVPPDRYTVYRIKKRIEPPLAPF